MVLARAASRAGRIEEAIARYRRWPRARPPSPASGRRSRDLGDEAAYLSAWLWYDAGDFTRSTDALEAFSRARPSSPRADDARWFAAWSRFRAGDPRGARARLARLESGPLAAAALYWGGRLDGASARAAGRLRRAAVAGGDGWYGWLARRRLERLAATPPPGPSTDLRRPGAPDAASLERLRAAADLLALGDRDRAVQELEALARPGAAQATAVEICRLASFAGEPALALRVARDLLGQVRWTERWLYPTAFGEVVAETAGTVGIDETLLHALIRRESGFRPEARSAAGALGLGQLLPRTAERLGLLVDLSASPVSRLEEPAANLALAALYLGLLLDRFGSEAGAIAAYNAGPSPPAAWSSSRAGLPLDEWVENVPFKETRIYLKAVLSSARGLPAPGRPAAAARPGGAGARPRRRRGRSSRPASRRAAAMASPSRRSTCGETPGIRSRASRVAGRRRAISTMVGSPSTLKGGRSSCSARASRASQSARSTRWPAGSSERAPLSRRQPSASKTRSLRHHRGDAQELLLGLVGQAPRSASSALSSSAMGRRNWVSSEAYTSCSRESGRRPQSERWCAFDMPHAELGLHQRRQPEAGPPQPARRHHGVEEARQPPAVLPPQAADVVVGPVQHRLAAVAEHLAQRPDVHGDGVDDVVGGAGGELEQADPLPVDVEAVGLGVERQHRLGAERRDQLGLQAAAVGDQGGVDAGHPAIVTGFDTAGMLAISWAACCARGAAAWPSSPSARRRWPSVRRLAAGQV